MENNEIVKSISQYEKLNNSIKRYNGLQNKSQSFQNTYNKSLQNSNSAVGKYLSSLNGANASIGGYIKHLVSAKASTIALTAASTAMNIALTAGISVGVGLLASQINKWIHAQEEAREKSIKWTNAYKEQQSSLDEQTEKYKELKQSLDNGNLSTDETRSIKEQLLEIQKSLIESYGDEASNIDLVNGKYREQLGILTDLSKEKADEYVAKNRSVYETAKKELEKIRTTNVGLITSWSTYIPQTEDQKALLDFISSYSDLINITTDNSYGRGSQSWNVRNLQIKATAGDTDEVLTNLSLDLEQWANDNNIGIDVTPILSNISKYAGKTMDDELKEYKTIYDEFMKAEVVRNDTLRPLYQESIQAVEDYNTALSTGEGVEEAKAKLDSVQQSVANATGELEGSQEVFDGMYNGINKDAEAVYNLDQAFENNDSVKEFAEQLAGLSDVDLKAINFDNAKTEKGEKAFKNLMDTLGLTEDQAQMLINKLVELGIVQGELPASLPDNESDIFSYTKLGDIPQKLSEVESAYKIAQDALEEYNEKGYNSMSTVDSILALEDEYISMLVDENGQLTLNSGAMNALARIKIETAKASVYQEACEELVRLKTLDTSIAAQELALVNGTLTESAYNVAKSLYEEIIAMGGANAALAGNVWDAATKKVKLLDNQLKNLNNGSYSVGISKAAASTGQATKDYIEAYMDFMEKSLESGRIDYQHYAHDVAVFLKNMYDDGKFSAKEYFNYSKQMLEYQKSVMDQVISAVDYRLEKEIDSYNGQIDSVKERYQTELDYLDSVIQYYEDQKTALQDANDEADRQLKLEQALYSFERAQSQRTQKVYTAGSGFVYKADGDAVWDASEDLREAKLDMEIAKLDEAIRQVEKQQEALQKTMDAETAALEAIISSLEAYRDKWNEISKEQEISQNSMMASQLLGADWENQILSGRLETLNAFRDSYAAIQQEMADLAWRSANEQIKAAQEAQKGAGGTAGSGTVDHTKDTVQTTQTFEVVHMETGKTVKVFGSKQEAKAYVDKLGQRIDKLGTPAHYIIRAKKYHKGLEEGLVGAAFGGDDFRMVAKFGLQAGEVPAVLKKNEAVLTEVQVSNLADVLRMVPLNTSMPYVPMADYGSRMVPATRNTQQSVVQNVNVTLPNITNEAGFNRFKKELDRLRLDAYQYARRRHR